MFEIQSEGRMLKVRPIAGALQVGEDGWLVMERVTAVTLAERIAQVNSEQYQSTEEGEDG